MTYQSSWGFSSFADDDLNVKLPILLGSNLTSNVDIQNKQTEFLLKFKVTTDLVLLAAGKVQKFRIKGDFEQGLSNFQQSRKLMKQATCFAYPLLVGPTIVVLSADNAKTIIAFFEEVEEEPFDDHDDEDECCDEHHLKHIVVFSILNHLLNNGYHSFADQASGVVARPFRQSNNGGGNNLLQVFAFRNCVVNSEGEGVLTVETFCYKMLPLTLPRSLLLSNEAVVIDSVIPRAENKTRLSSKKRRAPRCSDDDWEDSGSDGDCENESALSSSVTFIPTAEQVSLRRLTPYDPSISAKPSANVNKNTLSSSTSPNNVFLTPLDVRNRSRGYSLYLPDNYEAYCEYWDLAYGVRVGTTNGRVWLAHIEGEVCGERIVPLEALCRGVAELPNRSRLHAQDMIRNLYTTLSSGNSNTTGAELCRPGGASAIETSAGSFRFSTARQLLEGCDKAPQSSGPVKMSPFVTGSGRAVGSAAHAATSRMMSTSNVNPQRPSATQPVIAVSSTRAVITPPSVVKPASDVVVSTAPRTFVSPCPGARAALDMTSAQPVVAGGSSVAPKKAVPKTAAASVIARGGKKAAPVQSLPPQGTNVTPTTSAKLIVKSQERGVLSALIAPSSHTITTSEEVHSDTDSLFFGDGHSSDEEKRGVVSRVGAAINKQTVSGQVVPSALVVPAAAAPTTTPLASMKTVPKKTVPTKRDDSSSGGFSSSDEEETVVIMKPKEEKKMTKSTTLKPPVAANVALSSKKEGRVMNKGTTVESGGGRGKGKK